MCHHRRTDKTCRSVFSRRGRWRLSAPAGSTPGSSWLVVFFIAKWSKKSSAKYILTPQCCLASFTDWHTRFSLSLKEKQQYVVKGFWEHTVQTVNQHPDLLRGNKKKEGKGHCVTGSWFFWSRLSGRQMDNVVMTSDEEMLPENDRTHFGESWKIAITC